MSISDELQKLQELYAAGALTEQEYSVAKATVLGTTSPVAQPSPPQAAGPVDQVGGVAVPPVALPPVPVHRPASFDVGHLVGQLLSFIGYVTVAGACIATIWFMWPSVKLFCEGMWEIFKPQ